MPAPPHRILPTDLVANLEGAPYQYASTMAGIPHYYTPPQEVGGRRGVRLDDAAAQGYDSPWGGEWALQEEREAHYTVAMPRGRVLDIGCGTGLFVDYRYDATVHGFRSSFRSWCSDEEVDRELTEQALAHAVGSQVEQRYARSDVLERRREVMEVRGAFLGE